MRRHLLRVLQRAAVGQIGGDPRRPKRMITDRRENANRRRPLADHSPRIRLRHGLAGQFDAVVTLGGAEQEPFAVLGDAGGVDVGAEFFGQRMVAGHDVMFSAFLVQPELPSRALRPEILNLHLQRRANPGEGIGEGGDQRPVAQIAHRLGRDGVEQLAPFLAVEHRRLTGFHDVLRAAYGGGRVMGKNLTGDQPVEQHADGGELLLHVRGGMALCATLYICTDIEWPDRSEAAALCFTPVEERGARPGVGPPGIRVADIGGEEIDVAPGGLIAGVGDQGWDHRVQRRDLERRRGRRKHGGQLGGRFGFGLVGWDNHGLVSTTEVTHDKGRYHA